MRVILEGVQFFDASHGVIVGHDGVILTTANGGQTWALRPSGTGETLYGVEFSDATYGWASGTNGAMLMTRDGGQTWT